MAKLLHLPVLLSLVTALGLAGPLQFSGSASLQGNAEFISGDALREPYSNLTLNINPSLTVFGIPITTDILLSTMESDVRQALNKFRIGLDPLSLLRQRLPVPGFMQYLPKVDFGTFSPSYSALTLSGATVTGLGIEYQPWKLYIAGAGGRTQRAIEGSDTTEPAYWRQLYAARVGFGKKEATHYYLTILSVRDDSNSIERNWPDTTAPADTIEVVTPQENYVLGMEFNLSLFEDAFRLESEVAGMELIRDNRLPLVDHKQVPNWIERLLRIRWSSQFDYAYSVRPVVNVLETRVFGEVRMVGPGYRSLGAPALRNDNLAFSAGVERSFLNEAVSASASISRERDNLIGMKLTTTSFTTLALALNFAFPNIPYASLGYSACSQNSEGLSDRSHIVNLSTGHSFTTGAISHSPSLSFSWQGHQSGTGDGDYVTFDLSLGHSLGFPFPLTASANLGLARTAYQDSAENRFYLSLAPGYTIFGNWTNSLSFNGAFEKSGRRFDLGLNSSFPVWKLCTANLGIGRTNYQGQDGSYNEWQLTGSLTKSW
ncbi:MAG: hypothetical protein ABIK44_03595 [candidate division WOR-3 bacterium]